MNVWEVMPALLLLLLGMAVTIGMIFVALVIRQARQIAPSSKWRNDMGQVCPLARSCTFQRPGCWLAVRSRSLQAVTSALELHNPKPCSWMRGLTGEEKLFIAPPIQGWVLVMGSGLPDPSEDVDACFRFVMEVSRKLGQVQLFSVSHALRYHAWVRADRGKVMRAYAWAGRTVWQQGSLTPAERDLELKCFEYTEPVERASFDQPDPASSNVDKVPLLAARWSLDPAAIDERFLEAAPGIAGEPSRRY